MFAICSVRLFHKTPLKLKIIHKTFTEAAKERAPCVIFIDEIDSVGAKRTNSVLHPYANQTINQLLSEMDGFQQNEGVIVLGATNRREDLDQALMRPGRFDVEVNVPTPDYTGRKEIITHYLGKVLSRDINVDILARGTTGFTGADIENMINQAALRAAIEGAEVVGMRHIESARDKVLMGPERKARLPDEEANKITAYHEGGHAIVAYYTKVIKSKFEITYQYWHSCPLGVTSAAQSHNNASRTFPRSHCLHPRKRAVSCDKNSTVGFDGHNDGWSCCRRINLRSGKNNLGCQQRFETSDIDRMSYG